MPTGSRTCPSTWRPRSSSRWPGAPAAGRRDRAERRRRRRTTAGSRTRSDDALDRLPAGLALARAPLQRRPLRAARAGHARRARAPGDERTRSVARLLPLFRSRLAPVRPQGRPLTDDRAPVEWLTDRHDPRAGRARGQLRGAVAAHGPAVRVEASGVRLSLLARRPALTVLAGAVAISFSGILFRARARLAVHRRVLPLPLGAAAPAARSSVSRTGTVGPRPLAVARSPGSPASSSRRPDPLALRDRAGRRRARDRARQPAGRVRRPARVGAPRRAAVEPLARGDPGGRCSGSLLISGVLESGAYGKNPRLGVVLRDPDRRRLLGLPARPPGAGTRTWRAGRAAVRRHARLARSPASRSASRSATSTGRRARGAGLAAPAGAQLAGARLAADLDHAAAPAGRAHLGAPHVPAGALRAVRVALILNESPLAAPARCGVAGLVLCGLLIATSRPPRRRGCAEPGLRAG